jgi:hypothetical protein
MHKLVELDLAIRLLHGNDRVAKLDQVILLQIEKPLTNFLRLFLRGECDDNEIRHCGNLPDKE